MSKPTIIIIGAGIAGLAAARELSQKYKVIILEGQQRIGGRINTLASGETVIEAGAEFVHGKAPHTYKLLKEAGIKTIPVAGTMYRKEGGKWNEQDEMIEGWDKLIKEMKRADPNITLTEFLHEHYSKEEHANFRRHVIAFAEGFDVADPGKVSVQSLYKEWSKTEEENSRVEGGYIRLINFLHKECLSAGCEILTGHTVKQVDWLENEVTVYTSDNQKFEGQKLIVTAPVSILQKALGVASINFTPPIDDYVKAASNTGFGTVVKVIFHFHQPFWKEDTAFVFSDEMIPTWWTQYPNSPSLLTGWAGGPLAERMSDLGDDEITEKALLSLAAIFNLTIAELKQNLLQSWVFNWSKSEYASGAYSYATPATPGARKLLNTPLADTVFFAGESIHEGNSPGTVEAALTNGIETAAYVSKLLK
jgi:monoamine oxidase